MRFRLRTLLIVLALGPLAIYCVYDWGRFWRLGGDGIGIVLWLAVVTGFAMYWPRPKRRPA